MRSLLHLGMGVTLVALVAGSGHVVRAQDRPVIELHGTGTQDYACAAAPDGYAWKFKAPDTRLTDMDGRAAGRHFAGPSWQATDGSIVVGAPMASSPAPGARSIPWLLLRARSHRGSGAFATVGYIARTQTEGGVAPATGCDAHHAGIETKIPYRAMYTLFPTAPTP